MNLYDELRGDHVRTIGAIAVAVLGIGDGRQGRARPSALAHHPPGDDLIPGHLLVRAIHGLDKTP